MTASDAHQALDILDRTVVDVLLTDILMPEISGWELLDKLKASGRLPPFVVSMSVLHRWDALHESKAAGCHAHLVKPFFAEELVGVLERACTAIR